MDETEKAAFLAGYRAAIESFNSTGWNSRAEGGANAAYDVFSKNQFEFVPPPDDPDEIEAPEPPTDGERR